MNQSTAILIFAHSALEEVKNKHFKKGLELFSTLNATVIKTVKKTGLPYFIITQKEQTGNTFGERFTHAIDSVFKKGYSNIITIGNDCPELKTQQLQQAALHLQESKTSIGPTLDGGFYLLAFNKKQFDKKAFSQLPWQKASLRKELLKVLKSKNAIISNFCFFNDIDSQKDINYYLSDKNKINPEILSLLKAGTTSISKNNIFFHSKKISLFIPFNKGSPFVI